ncbi:hypothetical protein [Agrococcus sp. DT81.2]|uniref:hypothetical protein n=1 Tax=Agrococcus sp. DT81.2 TaxID=3393414 RepID=UPI003CE5B1F1
MEVQVLHIEECPSWQETGRRLRAALDVAGRHDVPIAFRLLTSAAEASQVHFAGSPTILVDGRDLFPSDGRTTSLACRIYLTPTGFAGGPTQAQIVESLASLD